MRGLTLTPTLPLTPLNVTAGPNGRRTAPGNGGTPPGVSTRWAPAKIDARRRRAVVPQHDQRELSRAPLRAAEKKELPE